MNPRLLTIDQGFTGYNPAGGSGQRGIQTLMGGIEAGGVRRITGRDETARPYSTHVFSSDPRTALLLTVFPSLPLSTVSIILLPHYVVSSNGGVSYTHERVDRRGMKN